MWIIFVFPVNTFYAKIHAVRQVFWHILLFTKFQFIALTHDKNAKRKVQNAKRP